MSTSHAHQRAFSVVELIVTMGVVAVLCTAAALGIPRLDAAMQLDAGLHQISSDLRAAQTLAIASARQVRVVFTAGSDAYTREVADDAGQYHRDLDRALPPGIRVLSANSGGSMTFSARGQAENGTVTLADARGTTRALQLNQRGRITILPGS